MHQFAELVRTHVDPALLRTVTHVVDAGSHDGEDCSALVDEFPGTRGIAIEGDPQNFRSIVETNRVRPIYAVLADDWRMVTWHRQLLAPKINGIYDRALGAGLEAMRVGACPISEVLRNCRVVGPMLLKVDCEGATLDVLMGLEDYLPQVLAMHLETEDQPFFQGMRYFDADVTKWCVAQGFREVARAGDGGQYDVVWVR